MNRDLNYKLKDSNGEKRFKNYIVIGGNRLSRGLTLEGLSISILFVILQGKILYQMARWFGYERNLKI